MAKFKNISDQDLSIPDIGIVKAGQIKEMPEGFNNANFEKVKEERTSQKNETES